MEWLQIVILPQPWNNYKTQEYYMYHHKDYRKQNPASTMSTIHIDTHSYQKMNKLRSRVANQELSSSQWSRMFKRSTLQRYKQVIISERKYDKLTFQLCPAWCLLYPRSHSAWRASCMDCKNNKGDESDKRALLWTMEQVGVTYVGGSKLDTNWAIVSAHRRLVFTHQHSIFVMSRTSCGRTSWGDNFWVCWHLNVRRGPKLNPCPYLANELCAMQQVNTGRNQTRLRLKQTIAEWTPPPKKQHFEIIPLPNVKNRTNKISHSSPSGLKQICCLWSLLQLLQNTEESWQILRH